MSLPGPVIIMLTDPSPVVFNNPAQPSRHLCRLRAMCLGSRAGPCTHDAALAGQPVHEAAIWFAGIEFIMD